MKIYQLIKWKNGFIPEDNPIMKSYIFFNFLEISRHFKGFQSGGFRIELLTAKNWFSFSFKKGFVKWLGVFQPHDKHHNRIVIRFNKPIISFGVVDIKHDFKNVEVV